MLPEKRVAVVVLNWNGFAVTDDCIQTLQQVSYPGLDVILVDNGSTDGSGKRLKAKHAQVILLESPVNAGFTGGNNLGLSYAWEHEYDYVLLLNNDTFVAPDFMEPLIAYMEDHPEAGIVQPKIYFNHDRNLLWNAGSFYNRLLGFPYTRGLNRRSKPTYEQICEVDWVTGCALMIRTSVLRKCGLLAPNMFLYCEDVDLSFRAKALGYQLVYVPSAVVYHIAGASGRARQKAKEGNILPQIHYYNLRNRIWLIKQYTTWYYWPSVLIAHCVYVSAVLLYFAIRGRRQKFKAVVQAVRDGITGSIDYSGTSIWTAKKWSKSRAHSC